MILAIEQDKLFKEIDVLPIDLKTKLANQIIILVIMQLNIKSNYWKNRNI